MTYVFIISVWCVLLTFFKRTNTKEAGIKQLILCFAPLLLLIATRVDWLPDDVQYEENFMNFHNMDWATYVYTYLDKKFEPGWFLLCKICPSNQFVLWVISILFIFALILLFMEFIPCNYWSFAFLLFFYNPMFYETISAQRSSVVVSLFMIATYLRKKNKLIYAIALVLISGLFHRTGFLLSPILLVTDRFISKYYKWIVAFSIAIIAMCLFTPSVFNEFLVDTLSDNDSFSNFMFYLEVTNKSTGYYIMQALQIGLVVLLLYITYKLKDENNFAFLTVLALVNALLTIMPDIGIGRIHAYFFLLVIAFLCELRSLRNDIYTKIYVYAYCIYTFYLFISFYGRTALYNGNFIIYHSTLF